MATNYDVLLRFILDEASKQKTKAGVDQLTGDIGDVEKIVRAVDQDFENLEKQIKAATSVKELDRLERQLKDVEGQVKETTRAYSQQAKVLRAEAAAITDDFAKARVAQIKSISDRIGGVSRTGLVAGGALVGGILAEANRFAKEAEDAGRATQATREWTRATQELAAARARVDQVLLREALPLLQQAARVATQASAFVERNPEIVQAALKVGVVVAGLGAVGLAVSKGIRLYADVQALALGAQELAAAKLQDLAADKQLIAARLRAGVAGVDVPGGGKGGFAAAALPVAGAVLANVGLSVGLAKQLDSLDKALINKFGAIGKNVSTMLETVLLPLFPTLRPIRELSRHIPEMSKFVKNLLGIGDAAKEAGDKLAIAAGQIKGSENEEAIVNAFTQWQEDDKRLVTEAAENRTKIIASAEKQIAAATDKYSRQRIDINRQFDRSRASIIEDFAESSKQAEISYAKARADIIRDAGEDIQRIEEQHQENIRKMTLEHNERVEELTAARDALGLAKEQRRFDQDLSESERGVNKEIAQRRQDTAARLAELAAEYAAERAQRQAQFEEALAENEARRQEELKQAAAAHEEQLKQIREQKAAQLRELQEGLNAERLRRREMFIAQIRDLDASLLGERNLRVRYYNAMLLDAQRFLDQYRARLPGGSTSPLSGVTGTSGGIPVRDEGGYMGTGLYRVAWNGVPEFALSGRTTQAAENIIGGRLTQEAVLNALARGSAGGRSLTINDHSRFDGRISASQVRAIKQQTIETIARELR